MTEYLAKINKKETKMLMHGEKFSIIPITTHINLKDVSKSFKKRSLKKSLDQIIEQIERKIYKINFKKIKFLCYNPHCSEENTLGFEDKIITEILSNFKKSKDHSQLTVLLKNIITNHYLFLCTMIKLSFHLKF